MKRKLGILNSALATMLSLILFACQKEELPHKIFEGNVILISQEEVNEFAKSGYNTINGNLRIGEEYGYYHGYGKETNITNLAALNKVTSVTGNLEVVNNPHLQSLTDLSHIKYIGKDILIDRNNSLTSLEGLNNIHAIKGSLSISNNNSLNSLIGLENLSSIEGQFLFSGNNSITSLERIDKLRSVGDRLWISHNESLTTLNGLQNITSVGGLAFINNPKLTSLEVFENITSLSGSLGFDYNESLTSLSGLHNIKSIGGSLGFSFTSFTSFEELINLQSLGGALSILYNQKLISLNGLNNITSIGGHGLEIKDNPSLNSIDALSNLDFVRHNFLIYKNEALSNFCPLRKLFTNEAFLNKERGYVQISRNSFNPSAQAIVDNRCEQ